MKQYRYRINGSDYEVAINSVQEGHADVVVNGISFGVEMLGSTLSESDLPDVVLSETTTSTTSAPQAQAAPAAQAEAPQGAGDGTPVKAPLPGVVTQLKVQAGQAVKRGDTVVVLEAMKMENNIAAECDGIISGIAVKAGDSVLEGTVLVTIA